LRLSARDDRGSNWAENETSYPRDLIETILAHAIGEKAEQAIGEATYWKSAAS
jgi:hypothetical protein